jgi:hypothetical protein
MALEGSYELQLSLVRTAPQPEGSIVVCLPVGTKTCTLVLSGKGGAGDGLEFIRGKSYTESEASVRPGTMTNDVEHTLAIEVVVESAEAELTVTLDDKPHLHWKGPLTALAAHKNWAMPDPRNVGLGSWNAAYVVRRMRVRQTPGGAKPPAKTSAPRG